MPLTMTPLSRRSLVPAFAIAGLAITALLTFASCTSTAAAGPDAPHAIAASVALPPLDAPGTIQMPGLHNVVTYAPELVCGGAPEGAEGLRTLAAMGIKTIVTVDGAAPDVQGAEALGIRYVHLPISYDTVPAVREKQLAQAISSLPGPIYMHCHHGKHRSAAALACASILAGKLTTEQAEAKMHISGTAKEYTGLWQAVREAKLLPAAELKVDPASFPSVTKTSGMVAVMSEIDQVIDLVKQAQKAEWKAPAEHPDLVAVHETKRLSTLFAGLANDAESKRLPADYQDKLRHAIELTDKLDAAVRNGQGGEAEQHLTAINKSCKDCHTLYRDK